MTTDLMTETEAKIAEWLTNKRINYNFESSLRGGRSELSGLIVPFIILDFNVALRIRNQDLYDGVNQTAVARIERAQLHNLGFIVVDAHEEDVTRNVDEVMNRAIMGREMSDLDSDLWFPNQGLFKGIPTFAGITVTPGGYGTPDPSSVVAGMVQTDAATGGQVLHGTLTYDGGGDCSVRFQHGLTTSYGVDTGWQTGKLTNATFSSAVAGLIIDTTYHFRAQARNKFSIVNGGDLTFVYTGGLAVVETGSGGWVEVAGKDMVEGTLTYDGGENCDVRFQHGLTSDLGINTDWQTGKITADTFLAYLDGYVFEDRVYYRAQARNSNGTISGEIESIYNA